MHVAQDQTIHLTSLKSVSLDRFYFRAKICSICRWTNVWFWGFPLKIPLEDKGCWHKSTWWDFMSFEFWLSHSSIIEPQSWLTAVVYPLSPDPRFCQHVPCSPPLIEPQPVCRDGGLSAPCLTTDRQRRVLQWLHQTSGGILRYRSER